MRFEAPEITTSKIETLERTKERLRELLPLLNEESESLKKAGFPVNSDCRLMPEAYEEIYRREEIADDLKKAQSLEIDFQKQPGKEIGDLLEITKTLAFNRSWFGGRLIAVRASKYDDYFNGVDEMIFDAESSQALAAIDTTINPLSSLGKEGRREADKILKKVRSGAKIKYGASLSGEDAKKQSCDKLPIFVVTIGIEKLIQLAKDLIGGRMSDDSKILEKEVIESLKSQSEQFQKLVDPKIAASYQKTQGIFEELG